MHSDTILRFLNTFKILGRSGEEIGGAAVNFEVEAPLLPLYKRQPASPNPTCACHQPEPQGLLLTPFPNRAPLKPKPKPAVKRAGLPLTPIINKRHSNKPAFCRPPAKAQ